MKISIYVSNLRKYNSGEENGRWIPLPMETEKLKKVFDDILGDDEELIILDYEAPFDVSQYENIAKLNQFMFDIEDYDEETVKILFKVENNKKEVLEILEKGNYSIVDVEEVSKGWGSILNPDELYGMVLNEVGYNNLFSQPIPEEMIDYIDFEQIYTCLSINDGWQDVTINDKTYLVTILR